MGRLTLIQVLSNLEVLLLFCGKEFRWARSTALIDGDGMTHRCERIEIKEDGYERYNVSMNCLPS